MHQPTPLHDRRCRHPVPRYIARSRRPPRATGTGGRVGTLYWLAVLAAGCAALGCVAIGLSSPKPGPLAGIALQRDPLTPKLNIIRTEVTAPVPAPDLAEPPPSAPALLDRNTADGPAPPALLPAEVIPVSAVSQADSDPVVFLPSRAPISGESPMMRTWKTLAVAALFAAALPPSAVTAGGNTGQADNNEVLKKVEALRSTVEGLSKKLDGLATGKAVQAVREEVEKVNRDLKQDLTTVREEQFKQKLQAEKLSNRLKELDEQLVELNEKLLKVRKLVANEAPVAPPVATADKIALDDFRQRLSALEKSLASVSSESGRKSFSPPANGSSLGRILLTNLYGDAMLFTVNGQAYRVEPNKTVELREMPPGPISYEVFADGWGLRSRRTTSLEPNQTLSIIAK